MDFLKCSLPWVFREAPCFILVIRIILKRRLNSRSGYPDFISDPCMGYGFILSGVCQLFFLNSSIYTDYGLHLLSSSKSLNHPCRPGPSQRLNRSSRSRSISSQVRMLPLLRSGASVSGAAMDHRGDLVICHPRQIVG